MTGTLVHRGPEGEGFWFRADGNVAFGHRRLCIIDLTEAAAQPMTYAGRFTITYNGEIYNYIELKETLQKKGYSFHSQSDTEVILAAYAYYGKDCLQYFDGMFAFAIWDEQEHVLFCARDRFGEKPFFYCRMNNSFLFASEMKALWAGGVQRSMNNTMLLNYLAPGLTSNPVNPSETFYKDIFKLPAGHYLQLKLNQPAESYTIDIVSYWDIDKISISEQSETQTAEELQQLLHTSVKRRLRSDVPLGTSLSGGLDSSSIVAIMQLFLSAPHAAFSAVFPGFEKDESAYIKSVIKQFNLQSFTVTPTPQQFINDFEKLCYHQEEPFQSSSIYAQYKVYELAKNCGVTVLLDGQGADETLAGYPKYYHWYWQELIAKGKWKTANHERRKTFAAGQHIEWNWKNYLAAYLPALTAKHLREKAILQQKHLAVITKDFFLQHHNKTSLYKPVVDKLNDILYFNTRQSGLEELLRYADRNSMAHSREIRLPFLNHELVQFIFSLPANLKIHDGYTKWILRKSMQAKLPDEIVWRKDKVGFEPPQQQWMQHAQVQEYMHESRRKLVKSGILKSNVLNKPVHANSAHSANNYDWRYLCAAQFM